MVVNNPQIFMEAQSLLQQLYGEGSSFRDGQYEAIESTLVKHRSLVVQRTGWGKSLVYFICTHMLRQQNRGMTLVVSPLLALMHNQKEAAERLGLTCALLNHQTKEQRPEILRAMTNGTMDLVFVTPETMFQEDVQEILKSGSAGIGLFVIDEAHCISDWGHDFRLDYCKLKEIIKALPANVPVLATTATANQRVIDDLKEQLGEDVVISRGPLSRDSLHLQVLNLESRAERYAWILENLKRLEGSGIIYCLTQRDCDELAGYLKARDIEAAAYHAGIRNEAELQGIEERFRRNELKVLVATIKLGMGYDKEDIAFVIHFQMSSNIVSYYQQIGRAGRNIPDAYVFLMTGSEDEDIIDFFIRSAFPKQKEMENIVEYLKEQEDVTFPMLEVGLNMRKQRIEKALDFLENEYAVYTEKVRVSERKSTTYYHASTNPFVYRGDHYQEIERIRRLELEQMKGLAHTTKCLSRYITEFLDDPEPHDCGHCVNCTGKLILPDKPEPETVQDAWDYLNNQSQVIVPKGRWPQRIVEMEKLPYRNKLNLPYRNQEGLYLCRYNDPGLGRLVKKGKYTDKRFSDDLLEESAKRLADFVKKHEIGHITFVPSLRSNLVEDFARRLAGKLGLPFVTLLSKTSSPQQKEMENSAHQCRNALKSFSLLEGVDIPEKVLLVDDMVDSNWTLTVCGLRLMEKGCKEVYPFALASTSTRN